MVIRSHFGTVKPTYHFSLHTSSISHITKSPFLALIDPHWRDAIYDEYVVYMVCIAIRDKQIIC